MEKYVVPLMIVEEMGTVVGKTRLQKIACIVEARAQETHAFSSGLQFTLHLHGPFSRELASLVDGWVRDGVLEEKLNYTPMGHPQYSYYLSDEGSETLRRMLAEVRDPERLRSVIHDVLEGSGWLPLPDLVKQAYAAHATLSEVGKHSSQTP